MRSPVRPYPAFALLCVFAPLRDAWVLVLESTDIAGAILRSSKKCLSGIASVKPEKRGLGPTRRRLTAMPGKKMPPLKHSVRSQVVGFGSEQGLSAFKTAVIAGAMSRILQERKRGSGPKDAACERTLIAGKGCPVPPFQPSINCRRLRFQGFNQGVQGRYHHQGEQGRHHEAENDHD